MHCFDEQIENLDIALFSAIPSISSMGDRRSWLLIQRAIRRARREYVYLEVGSYVGGSLQQYYLDPQCRTIYSIDKRPDYSPDERTDDVTYGDNTSEVMARNLTRLDPHNLAKVKYFEADTREIDKRLIDHPPDVCFIDGEHTHNAVVRDFEFCRAVATPNAAIYFHDASIVHVGLRHIVRDLTGSGISFTALKLTGSTFAIFLDGSPAGTDAGVRSVARNGLLFLAAMQGYEMAKQMMPSLVAQRVHELGKRLFS